MPSRIPIVGGNWKQNTNRATAVQLAQDVATGLASVRGVEVAVFPPFPYLLAVGEVLRKTGSAVALGAQDVYHQPDGAYTGEVSIAMLKDCGVSIVLTGHSERRHVLREIDDLINRKTQAVLSAGLRCILCIGETLDQRRAGETDAINETQVRLALAGVPKDHLANLIIAYEPVWAIGTGQNATPHDAQAAHASIRAVIADLFGSSIAAAIRIQYGGSVKSANAAVLLAGADVDGALVGGASLDAAEFASIVRAAGTNA